MSVKEIVSCCKEMKSLKSEKCRNYKVVCESSGVEAVNEYVCGSNKEWKKKIKISGRGVSNRRDESVSRRGERWKYMVKGMFVEEYRNGSKRR